MSKKVKAKKAEAVSKAPVKSSEAVRKCPACGGENLVRNVRGKDGKADRYRCKDAPKGDRSHPQTFLDPLFQKVEQVKSVNHT